MRQVFILLLAPGFCHGALFLSGSSYTQNIDNIGSGLPDGWSVWTVATVGSLGTETTFSTAHANWANTSGAFKNSASAEIGSGATDTQQLNATDRAVAVRQTTFGDPGAALVLRIENTTGFTEFSLSFKAQMLSVQPRSTIWTFDYRIGNTGDFTALGTYIDPGVFDSTTEAFTPSDLAAWNNQSSPVYLRVAALSASTGLGSRDTFGIDDFQLD